MTAFDQECQIILQIHCNNFIATSNIKNINFPEALPITGIAIKKIVTFITVTGLNFYFFYTSKLNIFINIYLLVLCTLFTYLLRYH